MNAMNATATNTNDRLNKLFTELEEATKASNHYEFQSLYGTAVSREAYDAIYEEALKEITIIQKRIIRTLLQAGELAELIGHLDAGTINRALLK
jgi:superfamily II DNA/RNA helicase